MIETVRMGHLERLDRRLASGRSKGIIKYFCADGVGEMQTPQADAVTLFLHGP